MIILGRSEPRLDSTAREIRKQSLNINDLFDKRPHGIVFQAPDRSMMITMHPGTRINEVDVYYECEPDSEQIDITAFAVLPGTVIPVHAVYLDSIWRGADLISIYSAPGDLTAEAADPEPTQ